MPNKQHLLTSIAAMARRLGRAPSLLEFVTGARIPKNSIFRLFPRWNDAVGAAGLQPYRLYLRPEDRELLTDWGETVRKLRAVPSRRAYDLNGKHYPVTLEKRFGGWAALPQAFRDFATGKREWDDVLALVPDPGEPAVGLRCGWGSRASCDASRRLRRSRLTDGRGRGNCGSQIQIRGSRAANAWARSFEIIGGITSGLPTILPRLPGSAFLASDGRLSGYPTHQDFKKPYSFA